MFGQARAHMESHIGLVEVGVGLVLAPGLTYIARRAAENMAASTSKDILPFLTEGFTAAAMGWAPARWSRTGLPAGQRRHRSAQGRAAVRRHQRSQVHGCQWLACIRQAPVPGRAAAAATIKAQLVNMRRRLSSAPMTSRSAR